MPYAAEGVTNTGLTADTTDASVYTRIANAAALDAITATAEADGYTATLYNEDGTVAADSTTLQSAYTFTAAGTYTLVYVLAEDCVWSDGSDGDIVFTIVIGETGVASLPTVTYKDVDAEEPETGKWEQVDEYIYTISLDEITESLAFFDGWTSVTGAEISVTVNEDDPEDSVTGDETTGSSAKAAGIFTVTVSLSDDYDVWADGTTGDKVFTFIVTESEE